MHFPPGPLARRAPPLDALALRMQAIDLGASLRRTIVMSMAVWGTPYAAGRQWGPLTVPLIDAVAPWIGRAVAIAGTLAWRLRRADRTGRPWRTLTAPLIDGVARSSGAQTLVGLGIGLGVAVVLVLALAAPVPTAPARALPVPAAPVPRMEVALAAQRVPWTMPVAPAPSVAPVVEAAAAATEPTPRVATPTKPTKPVATKPTKPAAPAAPSTSRSRATADVAAKPPAEPRTRERDRADGRWTRDGERWYRDRDRDRSGERRDRDRSDGERRDGWGWD